MFAGAELSEVGGIRIQVALWPSSKRRTVRTSGSIFSLRKLGACSGHCTVQRMVLTRLVSWALYQAEIPISTNKSQQSAATTTETAMADGGLRIADCEFGSLT